MALDPRIYDFIERARASGVSEQSLVGILTARGWPEKDVYEALARHYERLAGVEIPSRAGTGTAAKDAFFYLLVFSTLATWTFALGSLAFTLIDQRFADTLFSGAYSQTYDTYAIAAAMASMLVAFPIFLLVSRSTIRDVRKHPEKFDSPVRKWLTYMALVIAAGVFIGDLIAILTYLLRGEITSRFIAKALVVLVLSGGVFYYYFFGLRKPEDGETRSRWTRDVWMAIASTVAVIVMVILGFARIGAPSTQRMLRADQRRVRDLFQLSMQINSRWKANGRLPEHLDEISDVALADPITRVEYGYRVKNGSAYELCASFSAAGTEENTTRNRSQWSHPAGHHCFQLDATQPAEGPNIYFPD
jgi:Domain of unknown function (DUF5671)